MDFSLPRFVVHLVFFCSCDDDNDAAWWIMDNGIPCLSAVGKVDLGISFANWLVDIILS